MYFDFLKNITLPNSNLTTFCASKELHELCCNAERNARTDPDQSMIALRQAIEALVKGLLIDDGNEEIQGTVSLDDLLYKYKYHEYCQFIIEKMSDTLYRIKNKVNSIVHIEIGSNGDKQFITVEHATIDESCKYTIYMYYALKNIFEIYDTLENVSSISFDFLTNILLPNKDNEIFNESDRLYQYCCEAKQYAKTDSNMSMVKLRLAIEVLVRGLLSYDTDEYIQEKAKKDPLHDLLYIYKKHKDSDFIIEKMSDPLYYILKKSNRFVNFSIGIDGDFICHPKTGKHASVNEVIKCIIYLYHALKMIFEIYDELEEDELPIDEYEIINKIKKEPYENESIYGDYKYIGKKSDRYNIKYALIRPFKHDTEFDERDKDIQELIETHHIDSQHIITSETIHTSNNCEISYLAYNTGVNEAKTLDQIIGDDLTSTELLDIILQIAQGLNHLITDSEDITIYHRHIQPTCIFVFPQGKKYLAQIGCFETAKLEHAKTEVHTVHPYMVSILQGSDFIHPCLRERKNITSAEWAAGDVYSLAVVLLYCIDTNAVKTNCSGRSVLREHFSQKFFQDIDKILSGVSLDTIPSMNDFCSILTNEKNRLSE